MRGDAVLVSVAGAGPARFVIAQADADNAVGETQEGNNSAAKTISLGPDLRISSVSIPFTIAAGSTVSVTDVVQNQGADGAGPSTTRFYVSVNVALDATDVPLTGSRAVPALPAGASSSGSTSVSIAADTAPGRYWLITQADSDGAVAEGQETNNLSVVLIQVIAAPSGGDGPAR